MHGGFFDIYGLLFNIGDERVVDIWSGGNITGTAPFSYGIGVATSATALDYLGSGVTVTPTPEPSALALVGSGLLGMLFWRRSARPKSL